MEGKKKPMQKTKAIFAVLSLLLLTSFLASVAYGADGTSDGTINVVTECTITSPELLNAGESSVNASALTVNVKYHVNCTVSDEDGMDDIMFVNVQAWLAASANENDTVDENLVYSFWWNGSDQLFYDYGTGWLDDANWHGSASAALTQYEFCFQWDYSKVATYSNGANTGWAISIWANDTEGNSYHLGEDLCLNHGIAEYTELTGLSATHSWSALAVGSTDNALTAPGSSLSFTGIANRVWNVTAKSNATVAKDMTYNYELGIGNVTVNGADNAGASAALSTSDVDVPNLDAIAIPSAEAGTAEDCYMWVDIPAAQQPGAYEYKLTLTVQADS